MFAGPGMMLNKSRFQTESFAVASALLAFICFIPSLGCYFFADDFLCIDYLHKIFSGDIALFFYRLLSPWQDDNVQLLYRPIGDISLACDYLFWRVNPFGYHLTNVLLHCICTVLVFFLARQIFSGFSKGDVDIPSLFSALIFAAYPLHSEDVIWIVCRLDLFCTLFCLSSFLSFLKHADTGKLKYLWFGLLFYALALASKEVAVMLPVLFGSYLLFANQQKPQLLLKDLVLRLWPYFVLSALYMILRYLVLGTFLGGYTGTFGELYGQTYTSRLSNFGLYFSVFYPINRKIILPRGLFDHVLHTLYLLFGITLLIRIPLCPWPLPILKRMGFLLAWIVFTLLPTMQMIDLNINLVGSRVFYMPSVAMSMLFVLAIYPFDHRLIGGRLAFPVRMIYVVSCTMICLLILLFSAACVRCQETWITASTLVKNLQKNIVNCLDQLPANKKLILVNLSTHYHGAQLFCEFSELRTLMSKPLCSRDYASRLGNASPWFSSKNSVNMTRLQSYLDRPEQYEVRRVDWKASADLLKLPDNILGTKVPPLKMPRCSWRPLTSLNTGDFIGQERLVFVEPPLEAADIVFLEVTAKPADKNRPITSWYDLPGVIMLDYFDRDGKQKELDDKPIQRLSDWRNGPNLGRTYQFVLGEYLSWDLSGICRKFVLRLPDRKGSYEIEKVEIKGKNSYPVLEADSGSITQELDGICRFKNEKSGLIHFDSSRVSGAVATVIEISKPRYMFSFFDFTVRSPDEGRFGSKRLLIKSLSGAFPLTPDLFPESARYEVHVCAVDSKGNAIGKFSDPLTLQISSTDKNEGLLQKLAKHFFLGRD